MTKNLVILVFQWKNQGDPQQGSNARTHAKISLAHAR